MVIGLFPHLLQYKPHDGRSPATVARHLCSVLNSALCLAAAFYQIHAHMMSIGLIEVFIPRRSDPFIIEEMPRGMGALYVSLASYSACEVVWKLTSHSGPDWVGTLHRLLLAVTAAVMVTVDFVPGLRLLLFLQEAPSPFLTCWKLLSSFRLKDTSAFIFNGAFWVMTSAVIRIGLFGLCLALTVLHPDIGKLTSNYYRLTGLVLLGGVFKWQLVETILLLRDVKRGRLSHSNELNDEVGQVVYRTG